MKKENQAKENTTTTEKVARHTSSKELDDMLQRAYKKLDLQVKTENKTIVLIFNTFPNQLVYSKLKEFGFKWNKETRTLTLDNVKTIKITNDFRALIISLSKLTKDEIVAFAKANVKKSHKRFHKKSNGTQEQEQPKVEPKVEKETKETKETKAKKTKKVAKPTQAKAKVSTKVEKDSTKELVNATLTTLNETLKCLNELVKKL